MNYLHPDPPRIRRKSRRHIQPPTTAVDSKALTSFKVAVRALKFLNRAQFSFTSQGGKPFPPQKKEAFRKCLVPEDRLERNVDFANPDDQKVVTSILIVRPQRRYEEEVTFLQRAFKDMETFKELQGQMDEVSFRKVFRALRIQTFKPGEKIINYGDFGKDFYIIIKGSVYVLIKKETKPTLLKQRLSKQIFCRNSWDDLDEKSKLTLGEYLTGDASEELKRKAVEKFNPGFRIVNEIFKGQSFGEVALISTGDRRRTATVLCKETTYVGVLGYDDYCSIIASIRLNKIQENIAFLQTVDIFKKWKEVEIEQIARNMKEIKYNRKQIIFNEGDDPTQVYFIKKGEIELQKHIEKEKEDSLEESFFMNHKSKHWNSKPKAMKLTIMVKGGYFGEWDLSSSDRQEYTAVVYSTEVVLLSISRDLFVNLIKDKPIFQDLEKNFQEKKTWRQNFLSKIVDSRETVVEQSFTIEASSNQHKKYYPQPDNEYFGSDSFPNYFLHNLSPYKRPRQKMSIKVGADESMLTKKVPASPKDLKEKRSGTTSNTPSSDYSTKINFYNNITQNNNKEKALGIPSKIFSSSFMKKLSDEHPVFSRQRRRLENAPLKKRKSGNSSQRLTPKTEMNDTTNLLFGKTMTEPSKIYQLEAFNNNNASGFFSCRNTKVNTPELFNKERKRDMTPHQNEEKLESQASMFRIMKSLGLDKVYHDRNSPSWSNLRSSSYQMSPHGEGLQSSRFFEKVSEIEKESPLKPKHQWGKFYRNETLNPLNIPKQRSSFSLQRKTVSVQKGSQSHRD